MQPTSTVKTKACYDILEDCKKYFHFSLRTLFLEENTRKNKNNKKKNITVLNGIQHKQKKLHRSGRTHREKLENRDRQLLYNFKRKYLSKQQQYYQPKLQLQDFQLVETLTTMQLQHHLSIQQQELIQQLQLVQRQCLINKGFVKPIHLDYQALMQQDDSRTAAINLQHHQLVQQQSDQQQQQKHHQLWQQEYRKHKSMDKFVEQFGLSPQHQQQQQQSQHFEQIQFELRHINNSQFTEKDIKQINIGQEQEEQIGHEEAEGEDCANNDFNYMPRRKQEVSKRPKSIEDTKVPHTNDLQNNSNIKINNNNENDAKENAYGAENKASHANNSNPPAEIDDTSISPSREVMKLHQTELIHAQQLDITYNNDDDSPKSNSSSKYLGTERQQRQSQEISVGQNNKQPALFLLTKAPADMKIEDADYEDDDMEEKPSPDVGENLAYLTMPHYSVRSSRDTPGSNQQQHTDLYQQEQHGLQPTEGNTGPTKPSMAMSASTFSAHPHGQHTAAVAVAAALNNAVVAAAAASSNNKINNILDIIGGGQDSEVHFRGPSESSHHLESFNAKKNFHPLYAQGVCRWPSCELALDDVAAFIKICEANTSRLSSSNATGRLENCSD